VKNIGTDGSGVHCGVSNKHEVSLDSGDNKIELPNNLELNKDILYNFKKHYEPDTFKGKIGLLLRKIGLYEIIKKIIK
jgi:hypothetical protein